MEVKALRVCPRKSSFIPIPRMDFTLEKHLPSKLFMINELDFNNIFCPLAPAVTPIQGTAAFKFWSFGKKSRKSGNLRANWLWNEQGQGLSRELEFWEGLMDQFQN